MVTSVRASLLRFTIFAVVAVTVQVGVFVVWSEVRFRPEKTYNAIFSNVSALTVGDFVRIAGVEVGTVKSVKLQPDTTVRVELGIDERVVLTEGTRAVVRYDSILGTKFVALEEGAGGVKKLSPGGTIPLSQTAPALDLEALVGSFRPLLNGLEPDQVNVLTSQLIAAFQGQGPTIGSVLAQTAALTNALADRDHLIGQVITNLNSVLGSLSDESDQLGETVDSLDELVTTLEARKKDIVNAVAYADAAAGSVADLLVQARPPLQKVMHEADRTTQILVDDREYLDDLLNTLPDAYQTLGRLALHGDFFSFYLCDLYLKMNGKGGQPVYVKMAEQSAGRCTPK